MSAANKGRYETWTDLHTGELLVGFTADEREYHDPGDEDRPYDQHRAVRETLVERSMTGLAYEIKVARTVVGVTCRNRATGETFEIDEARDGEVVIRAVDQHVESWRMTHFHEEFVLIEAAPR